MTDKQIEQAKKTLPKWEAGKKTIYTPEQEQLKNELWCREMINSILCYDGPRNIMSNRYLYDYIKKLGIDTVQRLCDEQIEDFNKAVVRRNVCTDSEGVSYNSIIWADEM
jgi:hypothetical protein